MTRKTGVAGDTSGAAKETYNFLHGVLADKRLLGEDVQAAAVDDQLESELRSLTIGLLRSLRLPNSEKIFSKCPNSLMAAKVALAFYWLLDERLLEYEREPS